MPKVHKLLPMFEKNVADMRTDAQAERIVRGTLDGIVRSCPVYVLEQIAKVVVELGRKEQREWAENN